jgi:hypothetical protein
MFVKPAEGLVIPDPDRHDMLPADGRDVPASDFWMRRLRDGDVVEAAPKEVPPAVVEPAEPTHEAAP